MISNRFVWKFFKKDIYNKYLYQKKIRDLPTEEIRKIQWDRLKELLNFSYNNSDFYKKTFDSCSIKPSDINTYEDFTLLPIIDKKTIKKHYDDIKLKNLNNEAFSKSYTSGSTGEPFAFLIDKTLEAPNTLAAFMLSKEFGGIDPFVKNNEIMIKAEPKNEIKIHEKNIKYINKNIVQRIKYTFSSETFGIKSSDVKKCNSWEIAKIIKENEIRGIYGYSSNVYLLAKYFNEMKLKIEMDYVILIAEGLGKKNLKKISNTFNCPVYMDYGASECMRMGFKYDQSGYKMDIYNYFFEYLDDLGKKCKPNSEANIVVTNLNNYVFPLIRYKIGDRCYCPKEIQKFDKGYPMVSKIIGRTSETIKFGEDELSISNFDVFFEYLYDLIDQYQICIDEKRNVLSVKLVIKRRLTKINENEIKSWISTLINGKMKINIIVVDEIPFGKNGKTKKIIKY